MSRGIWGGVVGDGGGKDASTSYQWHVSVNVAWVYSRRETNEGRAKIFHSNTSRSP